MELTKIYLGDITFKDTDDGCVEVYGKATGPDLDLDYQICDPVWLAKAMPGWMETGANVRAMHLAIAAGIGIELAAVDESWFLKSLIVDANEVLKVKKKVYKGYSIGIANAQVIKDASAPNGRIVGGDIVEISIVDRPANPTALMELCKMAKDVTTGIESLGFITKVGEASPAEKITKAGEPNGLDVIGANPVTDPEVEPPTPEEANLCPDCSAGIANDNACATCGGTGVLPRADKTVEPDVEPEPVVAKVELEKFAEALMAMRVITKGTEPDEWKHDPVVLAGIRDGFIACITTELQEMASGEDERWDIEDLSWAFSTFMSWWQHEAWEGETPGPFDQGEDDMQNVFVGLGVKAEILKVATDDAATDEQRAEARAEIVKALGLGEVTELTALLKTATEGLTGLEDRLALAEEMAAPGGPSKRSTPNQQQKSDQATELRKDAAKFMEIAATLVDQGRKQYYIGKAQMATRDADALERV